MNRDNIRQIVQTYLPQAEEDLLQTLTERAEREIDAAGREIVRKLILKEIALTYEAGCVVDTKA